jgi:hypothetical protein
MSRAPGDFSDFDGPDAQVNIVAAADSSAKSRIPISARAAYVSAVTTDANDWIVLPSGVKPGHKVTGWSLIAHEMRTEASSNVKINNIDGDGTQEAAIPATTLWEVVYVSDAQGWILRAWDELAAPITAIIPDA